MDFREKLKYLVLETIAAVVLLTLLSTVLWTTTGPAFDPPNGVLFWLLILFICAVIGGKITELLRAPPLLGMLFAGFILRNTTSMQIGAEISAVLRNIALTVILLRAGFGLDPKALAKLSAVCFRLSFSPCIVETIVAAVTTHFIVGLPWQWGFLLGFAISAVSPAVVVPGLISLSERKYGTDKGIPTLVIAAASVDDVLAITGFGVLLGVVFSHDTSLVWQILKGPTEATVGLIIGAFVGLFLWYVPHENLKFSSALPLHSNQQRLILSLLFGFAIVFLSLYLEWSGVGPLGALTLSFVAALRWRNNGYDVHVEQGLRFIWFFCQPFLFALIGAEVRLSTLDKNIVASCFLCLIIGLVFRCVTSAAVVWGANLNFKEKLFIAIAWLPKATVQAAVGPVALDLARKMHGQHHVPNAEIVLNIAVLSIIATAPLGALLMAITGPRFLNQECNVDGDHIEVSVENNINTSPIVRSTNSTNNINNEIANKESFEVSKL